MSTQMIMNDKAVSYCREYHGKTSFLKFLDKELSITGYGKDQVPRKDFGIAYRNFCVENNLAQASIVDYLNHLTYLGITGKPVDDGAQYIYVFCGIVWKKKRENSDNSQSTVSSSRSSDDVVTILKNYNVNYEGRESFLEFSKYHLKHESVRKLSLTDDDLQHSFKRFCNSHELYEASLPKIIEHLVCVGFDSIQWKNSEGKLCRFISGLKLINVNSKSSCEDNLKPIISEKSQPAPNGKDNSFSISENVTPYKKAFTPGHWVSGVLLERNSLLDSIYNGTVTCSDTGSESVGRDEVCFVESKKGTDSLVDNDCKVSLPKKKSLGKKEICTAKLKNKSDGNVSGGNTASLPLRKSVEKIKICTDGLKDCGNGTVNSGNMVRLPRKKPKKDETYTSELKIGNSTIGGGDTLSLANNRSKRRNTMHTLESKNMNTNIVNGGGKRSLVNRNSNGSEIHAMKSVNMSDKNIKSDSPVSLSKKIVNRICTVNIEKLTDRVVADLEAVSVVSKESDERNLSAVEVEAFKSDIAVNGCDEESLLNKKLDEKSEIYPIAEFSEIKSEYSELLNDTDSLCFPSSCQLDELMNSSLEFMENQMIDSSVLEDYQLIDGSLVNDNACVENSQLNDCAFMKDDKNPVSLEFYQGSDNSYMDDDEVTDSAFMEKNKTSTDNVFENKQVTSRQSRWVSRVMLRDICKYPLYQKELNFYEDDNGDWVLMQSSFNYSGLESVIKFVKVNIKFTGKEHHLIFKSDFIAAYNRFCQRYCLVQAAPDKIVNHFRIIGIQHQFEIGQCTIPKLAFSGLVWRQKELLSRYKNDFKVILHNFFV